MAIVLALVVGLGGLWAACSDDDSGDDDGGNGTTESTATTLSPEAEVEAAYLAFADMGARLLENPDPEHPEIPQRTSGEAQTDLVEGLTTLVTAGQRYELGPEYSQDVMAVTVDGTTATAEICVVDDSRRVDASTGEVLAEGPTSVNWSVILGKEGGEWLVKQIIEGDVREGAVGCP